jgi:hypothetical protein
MNEDFSEIISTVKNMTLTSIDNHRFYIKNEEIDNLDICKILTNELGDNYKVITKEKNIIVFLINDKFILIDYTSSYRRYNNYRIFKLERFNDFSQINEYINEINSFS